MLRSTANPERNLDILTRVEAGESISSVARSHGITPERGRQIFHRMGRIRKRSERYGLPWPSDGQTGKPRVDIDDRTEVEALPISARARNCLARFNVRTVADLKLFTDDDLLHIPMFGAGCLADVRRIIPAREYGPYLPLRIVGGRKWFAPIEDEL